VIPSGYYTNTKGVDPASVRVVQFGIPRSGSTFVWQCLCDLLPDGGVIKTHDWLDVDAPVVVTLRDFRDVIVSRWRLLGGDGVMTREEIYQECGLVRHPAWVLERYVSERQSLRVVRYETDIAGDSPDKAAVVRECAALVGVPEWPWEKCDDIAAEHSIDRNRELSPRVGGYDSRTLLHFGHVHEGEVGGWKKFVRVENWQLVNDLLGDLLEKWGYA
jgi:hypothetical protein